MKGIDMQRTAWAVAFGAVLVLGTCLPRSAGALQDANRPPPATTQPSSDEDRNRGVAPPRATPQPPPKAGRPPPVYQPPPPIFQPPRQPFPFDRDQDRNRDGDRLKRQALRGFEREYFDRLHRSRSYWNPRGYSPYHYPYYRTAPTYRYLFNNRYYRTNRYGADLLHAAVNFGYREGLRAGRADRQDGWRFDYRNNYVYADALYGFYGYYVAEDQYRYYFREGFRRGYEDGYYGRYRHGRRDDHGVFEVLATVMGLILALEEMH